SLGLFVGVHLVEKCQKEGRRCALVAVHMHPLYPSATSAHVNFPHAPAWLPGRGLYHRLTHHLGWHGFWQLLRRPLNSARRTVLGLPALSPRQLYRRAQQPWPTLYAYSPTMIPPPAALPAHATVTGYWVLPPTGTWQPPAALCEFLAAGPPPVLISFGSILGGRDPNRMTELLVAALQHSGQRGLIYRGWGDLGNIPLPPTILAIESVPHAWLLPQVAAVVHHGGAGVTAATVLAQRPAVVVPVFGDQQLWAVRLQELGLAPAPIPRRWLTAARLAAAIAQAIGDARLATNLQGMAPRLQSEDGVGRAVTWLHTHWQYQPENI
ncbi:MAG: glycosyltransferase family 1 protein, partial [Caldilineaceae bacterium]|nr:glycosyltransferase family 1 protein [Caldilineaceae bacterium]